MLVGKRAKPPIIKRTTSMTEFTLDNNYQQQQPLLLSRRKSADFVQTAHFLRACFLCQRSLIPGHDIYMYRGDSAFCSLECREKQMNEDERKDKSTSVAATRKKFTNSAAIATATVARGTGSTAPPPQARP